MPLGSFRKFVQRDSAGLKPIAIRQFRSELILQLFVRYEASFVEIDQEHTTWLQATFLFDNRWIDWEHADFAGHDDAVIGSQVIPAGAQSISVECRTDVMAIGEDDRGGTIPRFHHAAKVLVEGPLFLRHRVVLLPSFGHHHHDGFLKRTASHQQELEDIIKRTRVRAHRFYDWKQLLEFRAKEFAVRHPFAGMHPVDVPSQRIDFAVVAHESQRLGAIPARERVGREPRVNHGEVGLEIGIGQVRIVRDHLGGG